MYDRSQWLAKNLTADELSALVRGAPDNDTFRRALAKTASQGEWRRLMAALSAAKADFEAKEAARNAAPWGGPKGPYRADLEPAYQAAQAALRAAKAEYTDYLNRAKGA
jgi:hypothetical protein